MNVGLARIRDALARCHTIWIIGDLRRDGETMVAGPALAGFADVVHQFCRAGQRPLAVALSAPPARRAQPGSDFAMVARWIGTKLRQR